MQLSLAFVTALMASSAAYAAPTSTTSSSSSLSIPLSRRSNTLKRDGSDQVDFKKMSSHLTHLQKKYENNFKNYQKNVGKKASLDRMSSVSKRGTGNVDLTDQSNQELWTGTYDRYDSAFLEDSYSSPREQTLSSSHRCHFFRGTIYRHRL